MSVRAWNPHAEMSNTKIPFTISPKFWSFSKYFSPGMDDHKYAFKLLANHERFLHSLHQKNSESLRHVEGLLVDLKATFALERNSRRKMLPLTFHHCPLPLLNWIILFIKMGAEVTGDVFSAHEVADMEKRVGRRIFLGGISLVAVWQVRLCYQWIRPTGDAEIELRSTWKRKEEWKRSFAS
jgi:hypothetical protein